MVAWLYVMHKSWLPWLLGKLTPLVSSLMFAYPEQFHIEKSKFTTLVGFTDLCSYRISLGNTKDEGLKDLWRDFVIKNS